MRSAERAVCCEYRVEIIEKRVDVRLQVVEVVRLHGIITGQTIQIRYDSSNVVVWVRSDGDVIRSEEGRIVGDDEAADGADGVDDVDEQRAESDFDHVRVYDPVVVILYIVERDVEVDDRSDDEEQREGRRSR